MSRTGANAGSPPGRVTGGQLLFLGLLLVAPGLALFRLDPAILPWLSAGLAGVWVVTALFVWADKRAAQAGAARTPEILLHTCELIGGWPAAFLAQRFWRHKTAKLRYRVTFWLIVLAHECLAADVLLHGRLSRVAWVELRRLLA